MKIFFKKTNKKNGYTIIETMIAVSLFVILVMMGMEALLSANVLHKKSQDMRSIINSLSFTMEEMSRNLRTGYNYHCIDDGVLVNIIPHSCVNGGGISFKSASPTSQWVYYIGTYNGKNGIFKSTNGAATFIQLNPDEVVIDPASGFVVVGAEPPPGDVRQPFVTIKLKGTITTQNVSTPFYLQTSVSQRQIDIGS